MLLLAALSFPIGAQAEDVMKSIRLSWDPSPSINVAGYRIRYGQHSGVYSHLLEVGNQTASEVPNLIAGTTYYFVVTAYSTDGAESDPSEEFHYTPSPATLLNISTRATVGTGDNIMIVGFIVGGMGDKKVVVRALGPSLSAAGIKGALPDPTLELRGPDGLIATNDSWQSDNVNELSALSLAPSNVLEAAVIATLKPGNYSAIVRGKKNKTGLALVEVYDVGN